MTLEELEKNVQTLEDINEIENMHRDFIYWLNNRQSEEWLNEIEFTKAIEYFTATAVIEMSSYGIHRGKHEVNKLLERLVSEVAFSGGRIIVTQPIIEVDGDKAEGRWVTYRFTEAPTSPPNTKLVLNWEQGECISGYVKEDGKWKFGSMKWTYPWPIPD
ncbi:nuclear transport factor 2 family protein [Chloroflexota bacterium]